jgi:nucleotide-binding universal stress UspA family protein
MGDRRASTSFSDMPDTQAADARRDVPSATFSSILCALDGTRVSAAVVRMAACLAGPDGQLTLLVVTAPSGSGAYASAAISPVRAEQILARAQELAEGEGVSCETVVDSRGPLAQVILERAGEHDLLVVGAPATSRVAALLIGGITSAALAQFTTPMLVVHRSFDGSLRGRRMLVASDGQAGSDELVDLAKRLARAHDAHLTLVHAVDRESDVRPHRVQAQAQTLNPASPGSAEAALVAAGKPSQVIADAAASTDAVLIVLGSRRLRGLRALGSVSRHVVHEAPCSVLVIPPH